MNRTLSKQLKQFDSDCQIIPSRFILLSKYLSSSQLDKMRVTIPFVFFALAAAVPTPEAANDANNLLTAISSITLEHDDVVIYGINGMYKIVKEAEFQNLTSSTLLTYGVDHNETKVTHLSGIKSSASLEARACPGLNSEFHVDRQFDFLDWDVQISPVAGAQQGSATISVTRGHQISNSITVGGNVGLSVDELSVGLKFDWQKTWTTIDTTLFSYTLPAGQYGVVISQPWTHRIVGTIYTSCSTDNWKKTPFTGNSHSSQTYGNMNWVTGVFRLCASTKYPIPYCEGSGYHY